MGTIGRFLLGVLVLAIAYLCFWPTGLSPAAWDAPKDQGLGGAFAPNERLSNVQFIDLQDQAGPEDIALGPDGMLYTGVESGEILKINPTTNSISIFTDTKGRPLGLEFDQAGNLIVADFELGLISIDPTGTITVLASEAEDGSVLGYVDDLDILPDGKIWFSDASTKFISGMSESTKSSSVMEIWEGAGTGRVLVYDPETGKVQTMMENILFSNGIAAGPNGDYVLVNETGKYRVLRYWINGEKAGSTDVFIDNMPGFPDNINRDEAGGFLLGLVSPRSKEADSLSNKPFVRNVLWRLPGFADSATPKPFGHLVRLDTEGNVIETWQDPTGEIPDVTGGARMPDGSIYVSSLTAHKIAHISP